MRLFAIGSLLVLAGSVAAQEDLTVLKPEPDGATPRKMLHAYLLGQTQKQFDARRAVVAGLKTPEDLQRRQQELKTKFIDALGGFPDKTPLNAQVVSKEPRDGYRIERVIYESRPQHHVTGILYLPESKSPVPGVILPCGHSSNGKASDAYQRASILLARNGIAVLCYDPIGQGERRQLLDGQGKAAIPSSTSEHTMVGVGALLIGQSTASYRIWDGIRSLDYLASRPEVDPKRLGCTGNSGGGTLTSYLMALDERIVAAAPSCYITSLERLFATIGPQDAEQNITGQVAFGMEHADFLTMRAPKPTLICAATKDFFDQQGTWTSFREAKQLYGLMGFAERVDLVESNTPHGFSKLQREGMVRFMRRWLLEKDDAPAEGDLKTFKDPAMQCTRTGQVLEDFKGRSVFDITAEQEKDLARQRAKVSADRAPETLLKEVRRLLALPATIKAATVRQVGEIKRDGYDIRKLVFETEPGIFVPALQFQPKEAAAGQPLVLYVHGNGKAIEAGAGGAIEKLVKAGNRVLALDLRGLGETAPGTATPKPPNYFGTDFKEIFLGLHLNRPLLGQRVFDLLAVVETLANDTTKAERAVHVIGTGTAGPIVLHAAALDPRIKQVTVEQSVVSWSAVARTPISHNQLTNVVAGALRVYDLPDLAVLVAPRPLTVRAAVDAVNKVVTQAVLDEAWAAGRAAYEKQKAAKQLTLQANQ